MKAECGFRYWRDLWKILSARDGAVRHHEAKVLARDVPGVQAPRKPKEMTPRALGG